jgi:hypothetical protein
MRVPVLRILVAPTRDVGCRPVSGRSIRLNLAADIVEKVSAADFGFGQRPSKRMINPFSGIHGLLT